LLQLFNKKLTRKDLDKKYTDLINERQIIYDSSNINSVENGIFDGLNKLESIKLANNEINNIDKIFQCSIDYKLSIEINELKENHFRLNIDLKIIQNNLTS
jgi:pyruvate carboxylase